MCNFCGEGGNEAGGDEDAAFDMGSFLDMCTSKTTDSSVPTSAYEVEDFFAAIPVHSSYKEGGDFVAFESEELGAGAPQDASEGIAERQQRIHAVMGWAAAQLEAAGYGRGRVVTVSCPPGVTIISLLSYDDPLQMTVPKGIGVVTEADVQQALAEAASGGGAAASGTTTAAPPPSVPAVSALAEQRAKGELPTLAKWTRDFVAAHMDYDQDSVVSPVVATDLLQAYVEIAEGRRQEPAPCWASTS